MCRRRGGAARYRCCRCRCRCCRSPGRRTFGRRPASVRRAACRLPPSAGRRHAARCSAKPPVRRGDAALLRQTAATRPPRDSGRPAAPAAWVADRGSRSSGPSGLFRAGPARRIGERGGLGVPPDRPLASSVVVPAAVFSIGRLRTRGCRARQTDTERDTERGELDRSRRRDLGRCTDCRSSHANGGPRFVGNHRHSPPSAAMRDDARRSCAARARIVVAIGRSHPHEGVATMSPSGQHFNRRCPTPLPRRRACRCCRRPMR
ncbi:Uncharacterised protein [Burkholderia pseudomallei]|nr:Uncharacterised protein [Burkholderia pseudomallei]VCA73107.1 Uncharacterised protein [Burkholderia pseudomallei]VCA74800.1 Uncharacterised protein [Burkholderia pseudomallei]VCA79466.1 Uncharacterised protein [Burkholderia pseudomallei]VCA88516.1 Uncharacterised protein [Burkholderia pseudomallei]